MYRKAIVLFVFWIICGMGFGEIPDPDLFDGTREEEGKESSQSSSSSQSDQKTESSDSENQEQATAGGESKEAAEADGAEDDTGGGALQDLAGGLEKPEQINGGGGSNASGGGLVDLSAFGIGSEQSEEGEQRDFGGSRARSRGSEVAIAVSEDYEKETSMEHVVERTEEQLSQRQGSEGNMKSPDGGNSGPESGTAIPKGL